MAKGIYIPGTRRPAARERLFAEITCLQRRLVVRRFVCHMEHVRAGFMSFPKLRHRFDRPYGLAGEDQVGLPLRRL